jgi:hypothetical protein
MDGSAFRSQQNEEAGGNGDEARDEMHPSEREEVEVHGCASICFRKNATTAALKSR